MHKLALNDPVKYTLTYRDITPSSYQTPLLPKVICKPPRNFLEYDEKTTIFQSKPFQIYIVRSKILRNISSKTSFKVKSRSEEISYINNKLMKSYLMINDIEVTRYHQRSQALSRKTIRKIFVMLLREQFLELSCLIASLSFSNNISKISKIWYPDYINKCKNFKRFENCWENMFWARLTN